MLDDPLDRCCCCCGEPLDDDQDQAHPECWAQWHDDEDNADRYGLCWVCDEPLEDEDQAWLEAHPDCVDRAALDPDLPPYRLRGRRVEDVPDPARRFA